MGSPGWSRSNDNPINSRVLCQLSYGGSADAPIVGHPPANIANQVAAS